MTRNFTHRARLLGCSAIVAASMLPAVAWAQDAAEDSGGLEEIIVTAQKREQSVQDVPIAVTAVTEESLQANRIYSVNDLSAIAPGLTVKPSAGGINVPAFTMRGQVSFGVVAGSDKQVSIYLDGVYIASPRASIFDLPDIQRLEVLRGPQGTLFGRNATAGAVSVTTRDPSGDARMRVEGTYGNYDAYRVRATVETPEFGPFSALFSYVRNYRRGEIENSFAGLAWDRTNTADPLFAKKAVSPRWLGTVDTNSYFAAVKFEPSDTFKMVYKYDRNDDKGTPQGTALTAYDGSGLFGAILGALYTSNNVHIYPNAKRPDIVENGWAIPRNQRVEGHSLTATWNATDSITVKNIAAYRKAYVFSPSPISGAGTLTYTQETANASAFLIAASVVGAPLFSMTPAEQAATVANFLPIFQGNVGQRIALIDTQSSAIAKQWSNEIQVNYSSDKLQLTLGGLWFKADEQSGGPVGQQNTFVPLGGPPFFSIFPQSGIIPLGNEGRSFNKATSLAAYIQAEYKITPELEVVAGARITHDKKSSAFRYDIVSGGVTVQPTKTIVPPDFKKTKPNFLIGLNWTPNDDTLVYAKWSNSFVSGGSTAGIDYEPETASSFEVGVKADFLDRKLRANLAVFHVDYKNFQSPQGTSTPSSAAIALAAYTPLYGAATAQQLVSVVSTFVISQGTVRAKGFELELTAAPIRGLTIGSGIGYTDVNFPLINPIVLSGNGGRFDVTARPKWTVNLYGSYETEPLFGDATLQFRMDGQYRSHISLAANPLPVSRGGVAFDNGSNAKALFSTPFMLVNGRVALRHLTIGGAEAELAFWGKNITNRKDTVFALPFGPIATTNNFVEPRTFGVDLSVEF